MKTKTSANLDGFPNQPLTCMNVVCELHPARIVLGRSAGVCGMYFFT